LGTPEMRKKSKFAGVESGKRKMRGADRLDLGTDLFRKNPTIRLGIEMWR